MSEEFRGYPIPEEAVKNFGLKMAQACNKIRSSHVFFILQQAYPEYDDWDWSDFQELIDKVLQEKGENETNCKGTKGTTA